MSYFCDNTESELLEMKKNRGTECIVILRKRSIRLSSWSGSLPVSHQPAAALGSQLAPKQST
jgi:hypothetical protein